MGYFVNRYDIQNHVSYGGAPIPDTQGTIIATSVSPGITDSLPVDSWITEITCYASVAGSVKIKVIQPSTTGGYNVIYDQSKTLVVGLNTFTDLIYVPRHSMLSVYNGAGGGRFYFDNTQSVYIGYIPFASDATGNIQPSNTLNYANRVNIRYKRVYNSTEALNDYIIDESFPGTTCPAYCVNGTTPWVFTAGVATSGGTGIANGLHWHYPTNIDRNTWQVDFEFTGASDEIALMRHPNLTGSGVDDGTIVGIDCATNSIKLYAQLGTSNTLPSVGSTTLITALTLAVDTRYRATLYKNGHTQSITITDVNASTSQTVSVTNATSGNGDWGRCYGRPGIVAITGTVEVYRARFWADQNDPRILLYGDSIIQGSGQTPSGQFAQLVLDHFDGNGWYSGDGGTRSDSCLKRLQHDLRICLPEYVLVMIGTNNVTNQTTMDEFYVQILEIYKRIVEAGATPMISTLLPRNDGEQTDQTTLNSYLIAQGWRLIRGDLALSVNNDGSTYNAGMMFDNQHPDDTGAAAWFARAQLDFPEVFS